MTSPDYTLTLLVENQRNAEAGENVRGALGYACAGLFFFSCYLHYLISAFGQGA